MLGGYFVKSFSEKAFEKNLALIEEFCVMRNFEQFFIFENIEYNHFLNSNFQFDFLFLLRNQ